MEISCCASMSSSLDYFEIINEMKNLFTLIIESLSAFLFILADSKTELRLREI